MKAKANDGQLAGSAGLRPGLCHDLSPVAALQGERWLIVATATKYGDA